MFAALGAIGPRPRWVNSEEPGGPLTSIRAHRAHRGLRSGVSGKAFPDPVVTEQVDDLPQDVLTVLTDGHPGSVDGDTRDVEGLPGTAQGTQWPAVTVGLGEKEKNTRVDGGIAAPAPCSGVTARVGVIAMISHTATDQRVELDGPSSDEGALHDDGIVAVRTDLAPGGCDHEWHHVTSEDLVPKDANHGQVGAVVGDDADDASL